MRIAGTGLAENIQNNVQRVTLTLDEARVVSGIGRGTLLRLLQTGEIRGRKIGARRWIVLRDSLEAWLRGGQ